MLPGGVLTKTSLHSANVHTAAFAVAPLRIVRKTDLSSVWCLRNQMVFPMLSFTSFLVLARTLERVPKIGFSTAFAFEALLGFKVAFVGCLLIFGRGL